MVGSMRELGSVWELNNVEIDFLVQPANWREAGRRRGADPRQIYPMSSPAASFTSTSSGSSVTTLVADAASTLFGWARQKRKRDIDDSPEPKSRRPFLRNPFAEESRATSSDNNGSRKRFRDWEAQEQVVPASRDPQLPSYDDVSGFEPLPDYSACPPPSKRARRTVDEDWKASVLDTLSRPIDKPGLKNRTPPRAGFPKMDYGDSYDSELLVRGGSKANELNERPSASIKEKLASLVSGDWVEQLRKESNTKSRPQHGHYRHGRWTARVAALWKSKPIGHSGEGAGQ